jgi:hypothetical protein
VPFEQGKSSGGKKTAGFLNGPGFQKLRDYLRRTADAIWVIDCSPEGHQPEISTRIFQGVQQPVCIVLVARSAKADPNTPTVVRFRALPAGNREHKFAASPDNASPRTRPPARTAAVPRRSAAPACAWCASAEGANPTQLTSSPKASPESAPSSPVPRKSPSMSAELVARVPPANTASEWATALL